MRAFAACIAVAMVTILAALAPVQAGADDDPRGRLHGTAPGVAASPPPDDADDAGISASEAPVARSSRPTGEPESGERGGSGDAEAAGTAVPERGELLPVLPFGTGLACLGLGIGLIGYRLRRAA